MEKQLVRKQVVFLNC